ncbi:phosphoethanolamine transferase [Rufibacter roseus]|uniref:Phosphoethanolamine transferase n=1 Tax=Rufibacter roseus TaxID=1567108 RepID=A0ABW2DR04_9BACT|nr:phosphoethanolamine transferase [Rufibacter roseus]
MEPRVDQKHSALYAVKSFFKSNLRLFVFLLLITFLFGALFISADFLNNPYRSFLDFLIIALQWGVVLFATSGLLYLLAINKYIFAAFFPILTIACAVLAYFRVTANVIFTPMILDAALDNDLRTSLDLVSWSVVLFAAFCALGAVWAAVYRFKNISVSQKGVHLAIAAGIIMLPVFLVSSLKAPVSERIPYVLFFTVNKYLAEKEEIRSVRNSISDGASSSVDSLTVVFVLGESLRADHLGLNGYHRNTTPHLSQRKAISLPHVYSEYTYTNRSIPHILTRADSAHTNRAFTEESFINVFNKSGFYSSWLANQESAESYVYFMNEAKNLSYANLGKTPYSFEKWVDGELLPLLENELQKKQPKKLLVLHTVGSHWWYNSHFTQPYQQFTPVVKSRVISACTAEEMINSYDNTVLYTDYFIHEVIKRIEDQNAILIYLSDHGESLGENGYWLHATDRPEVHSAASFVWVSEKYGQRFPKKVSALKENAAKPYRTDFLFHSILDAAEIKSPYLQEELSIFKGKN